MDSITLQNASTSSPSYDPPNKTAFEHRSPFFTQVDERFQPFFGKPSVDFLERLESFSGAKAFLRPTRCCRMTIRRCCTSSYIHQSTSFSPLQTLCKASEIFLCSSEGHHGGHMETAPKPALFILPSFAVHSPITQRQFFVRETTQGNGEKDQEGRKEKAEARSGAAPPEEEPQEQFGAETSSR